LLEQKVSKELGSLLEQKVSKELGSLLEQIFIFFEKEKTQS
jgi:hypothetical protein